MCVLIVDKFGLILLASSTEMVFHPPECLHVLFLSFSPSNVCIFMIDIYLYVAICYPSFGVSCFSLTADCILTMFC